MKFPWFRRYGLFFLPVSLPGWLLLLGVFAFLVFRFRKIDAHFHSISDTLK